MKILLVNEASGLSRNLKSGFIRLGHEVTTAIAGGATHQGRETDYYFGTDGNGPASKVMRNIAPLWKIRGFKDFDVVNYILGITAFSGRLIRHRDVQYFKRHGVRLSYYGLGCDEISLLRVRPDAAELACAECMQKDILGQQCADGILSLRDGTSKYAPFFDYCTTTIWEYSHAHDFFPNAKHARIAPPLDASQFEFLPATPKAKPLIVHAPTRRGFKGTEFILRAIERLGGLTDRFEFRLIEGVSFAECTSIMKQADVIIDQALMKTAGYVGLEAMAMGKIVVAGNDPEARAYYEFGDELPVIPVSRDPERLATTLLDVLENQDRFPDLAARGRAYVENHHDPVKIAGQFIDLWQS